MKKIVLSLCLLLSLTAAFAAVPGDSKLDNVVSKFRSYEGVEVFHLNRFMVWALKGAARIAGAGDADMREALALANGVRSLTIMEYGECSPQVKCRINRRIDKSLRDHEILLEAGDSESRLQLFGVVDESHGTVRDLVLFNPGECTLIFVSGSISANTVSSLLASND